MNAIEMLDQQHDDIARLLEELDESDGRERAALFAQLADQLAIHTLIEERHFYPEIRAEGTEQLVRRSYDEHREIKLMLIDLLDVDCDSREFNEGLRVLRDAALAHVDEERREVFPAAREVCDEDQLDAIAQQMMTTMTDLIEEGEPRRLVAQELLETQPTV
jgi:hemerythrin-like domain-containing protein